jgi:hypothetical protein
MSLIFLEQDFVVRLERIVKDNCFFVDFVASTRNWWM